MSTLLRVGIIGLGSRWEKHYKPTLLAMREQYQIQALYDQVQERAVREARLFGCAAAAGVSELLTREDVEALLLLGKQWFGLWPLELACRFGKPVFYSGALDEDEMHIDALQRRVYEARLPVMMGLSPRFAPATVRLREMLASRLGTPRLLLCETSQPRHSRHSKAERTTQTQPALRLLGSASVALVDWCLWLLDSDPVQVFAAGMEDPHWSTLLVECADERGMQITRYRGAGARRSLRLQVVAERGSVNLEMPDLLSWATTHTVHTQRIQAHRSMVQALLEHFWRVVKENAAPEPSFEDAYGAFAVLRCAARSRASGQVLALAE